MNNKKYGKEEYERETKEMLEIINNNYKKAREKSAFQQQVETAKKQKEIKARKRLDIATLIVMVLMLFTIVFLSICAFKNYNDVADKCDAEKGYICSDYEVRQYAIRGE